MCFKYQTTKKGIDMITQVCWLLEKKNYIIFLVYDYIVLKKYSYVVT